MKLYRKWSLGIALLGVLHPVYAATQSIVDVQQELLVPQELQSELRDLQDLRELQGLDETKEQLGLEEFVRRSDKRDFLDPRIADAWKRELENIFPNQAPLRNLGVIEANEMRSRYEKYLIDNEDLQESLDHPILGFFADEFQVLPGIEVDEPKRSKQPCRGRLCGIGVAEPFTGNVDYERRAHDEVLLLLHQRKGEAEWTPHCSSVAIAPRYALTALHCFGSAGEVIAKNFNFEKSVTDSWVIGNPTGRTKFVASVGGNANSAQYITIKRIMIPYRLKALPSHQKSSPPRIDLALIEFGSDVRGLPLVEELGAPGLAKKEPISFAGYGLTNVSTKKWLRYAAFNEVHAKIPRHNVSYVAWISDEASQKGGPCRGDSGGPVYRGFERGFANDPNTVVAIVSHFPRFFEIKLPMNCAGELGYAVRLDRFVEDICKLSNRSPRACR